VPGADAAVSGTVDVPAALAQRDYMTADWDDTGQLPWLTSRGVAVVRGEARVTGPRIVDVDGRRLVGRRAVVLATDPRPRRSSCVGQPSRDFDEGATPPSDRPGRRSGRRGAGAGLPPARLR
jgi:pyruvate/2-oxoglutarate dehydrogenase complex dihydrolipoamide dehydrogenase (E3) component